MSAAAEPGDCDPLAMLEVCAGLRAHLVNQGEMDLLEAVDGLQDRAERQGLVATAGQDEVQRIIADAFRAVLPW